MTAAGTEGSRAEVLSELTPAIVCYVVEAMIDGGVFVGLPRGVAQDLVVQATSRAARMIIESNLAPNTLRSSLTTPAGITARALRELENHRVRAAFFAAAAAATASLA